jgi:hypothetical protein
MQGTAFATGNVHRPKIGDLDAMVFRSKRCRNGCRWDDCSLLSFFLVSFLVLSCLVSGFPLPGFPLSSFPTDSLQAKLKSDQRPHKK